MRTGRHPLKTDIQPLRHRRHRIILPFWIPNIVDDYFKEQPEVLRLCLESLVSSIDSKDTAITLINNNSCFEATSVAEDFVAKGVIDKYVVYNENRGKLDPLLAEARASQEPFLTLADADFLFLPGWEKAVSDVMRLFPMAGMVTPFPTAHLTYFYNNNLVFSRRHFGNVVDGAEVDLFEQGLGHELNTGLYSRPGIKKKQSWREGQYFAEHESCIALFGAVHALATFRREVVRGFNPSKVSEVFRNGYEHDFIDLAAERKGYLRMSTPRLWAYHLGNSVPENALDWYAKVNRADPAKWESQSTPGMAILLRLMFPLTRIFFRAFRKWKLL
jgi:hypothetical protein